jgi:hypothetical protein
MVDGPGGSGSNQYEIKESAINDNIINTTSSQGTSKAYTVSRLKRDRPDLFEKVVAGELSANKAAIEAGFRRKPEINAQNCVMMPTQAKYASEMGVSRKTVNDWESDAKILD